MKSIIMLQSELERARKTEPGYDGDEINKATAYLKHVSDALNETLQLPYFKSRITVKNQLKEINTKIDNLFYKLTEATMYINH